MNRSKMLRQCYVTASYFALLFITSDYLKLIAENMAKCLNSLEMVPRAGIEPARPILSYPRILSPEDFPSYLIDITRLTFKIIYKSYVKLTSLLITTFDRALPMLTFSARQNSFKFITDRWPFRPFQHVQGGALG